ncbi:MAG TPA: GNAT family N-acetyltransferase [Acidimicrobiales bacterium]|nr:GNAT family N-acetyltransferase [Acidimicrobiales bacterium]
MPTAVVFEPAPADQSPATDLLDAMRGEMAELYDGLDIDDASMPSAGPADFTPPRGTLLVGRRGGVAICVDGLKDLGDGTCEIKRMFVVPAARRQGVAAQLLAALEALARELGFRATRLDTGPRQPHAIALYEAAGYRRIHNFNDNPIATFHGEKDLGPPT